MRSIDLDPYTLVLGYAALARVVGPAQIPLTVHDDPDDDDVLACAVAARADVIVSGDSHLLSLKVFRGIPILRASDLELPKLPAR